MSSEQEGSESKLLTGSTPTTATTSPVKANKLTDTEEEIEAIAAAVQPDSATMGDVLTKEHKDDNTSELQSDLPQPDDGQSEENETCESIVIQEQPEPPPPPSPPAEEPTELTACDISPTPEPTSLPDVPEEDLEIKESELLELVMLNNQEINNDGKETIGSQNKEQFHAVSTTTDDLCSCEDNKLNRRDLSTEDLQEMMKLRRLGMDLRRHIRFTFNWFMETNYEPQPDDLDAIKNFVKLRESVVLLCDRVPYHLFMWMVGQAQEFIIGVKVQLFTILYDRSIDNLAEVFLTKLLHGYEALLSTALHAADLLEPLQQELFSKVNMTWGYINKSLYQSYVYSDPLIQNNLPPFIGQLRKRLPMKGSQYHYLVHRYLAFDDEITKIGTLCPEIERIIDKYNAEQVTGSVMKKLREDFERCKTRLKLNQPNSNVDLNNKVELIQEVDDSNGSVQNEEVLEIQSMFNDWKKSPQQRLADLIEALTTSKTILEEEQKSKISKEKKCFPSCLDCLEKAVKEDIDNASETQAHVCLPNNPINQPPINYKFESAETILNEVMNICTADFKNPKDPVVVENNESNECPPFSRYSLSKQNSEDPKEPLKKISKTTTAQTAQTQTRHSTTQTPSATHNQSHMHRHHHQGRLSPGENGDCSDSGSSHEDSCSATNSPTPRDSSRHCDCCYCEVFGHGVPSVAPVSRNYKEMRERLRQLLSRKKAKVCKAACNPHTKSSVEVSLSSSSLSSSSSTSSTMTNVDTIVLPNPAARSNTPTTTNFNAVPITANKTVDNTKISAPLNAIKDKEDQWNIEAAVEFIEGNQSGKKDKKKAEKKARQKQKKLEEKMKKEKEEENQLKLIELQKKTPEVTITVVNPQKQGSQRPATQPKLPEVSILPTISMQEPASSKQANTVKKKNGEIGNNSVKNANRNKLSSSTTSVDNVKKKTASVEKINEVISINHAKSKIPGKTTETVSQVAVNDNSNNLTNLTKKERKKLRREMEKQEALKKELESKQISTSSDSQLQIVTIKRIMESNNAEPTVTITLKGQTPAEDRVLFTLVNGQTKDSTGEKQSQTTSKKKKNKGNGNNNQPQQGQSANKNQHSCNNNAKFETSQKHDKPLKQQQPQQTNKDKAKINKQEEKIRQQHSNITETNSGKSKKDKKKNNENKENIMKSVINENSQKQEINSSNKKSNKISVTQPAKHQQQQQQQQQNQKQQLQQQPSAHSNNSNNNKNTKGAKNQNLNQNQNQKKNNNNIQINNSGKVGKSVISTNNSNQSVSQSKIDTQKFSKVTQNIPNRQKPNEVLQNQKKEQIDSSLHNHYKETHSTSSINIENLKLPPGITITKVDAPVKPLPLKSNSAPKPSNNSPKQTTIIAAPMSGVQSSTYSNSQNTGNVIVVDTGRLKQDLIPKDGSKDQSTGKKKKKKKNKNSTMVNGNEKINTNLHSMQGNKQTQQHSNDYMNVEPARILHNPSTNMVTIRNPAFGPPPPKMEPSTQQAAIIKVAENGMVTIRSPALQQAINAGLQPPPKPDFIVKGSASSNDSHKPSNNSFMNGSELSGAVKGSNGMQLSTDLAELRRRLAHQPDNERTTTSSTLFNNGLSSIQISKVTNGQSPHIPENGINLKGTSVTLTKIRSVEPNAHSQQQQQHYDDSKGNTLNGNVSAKSRKKKKRGTGVRQNGDDWNLVESVFTPKDIDLEDGEMDDAERELEAFKRFCLQSVPPPRKEKVNLNLKDIVLKKKSSSSASLTASAAATAAAVVATI